MAVSMAMWKNFMQFVSEEGVPLRELEGLARITNLPGLERWGYVVVEPDPADSRPKPRRSDWVVRATPAGLRAQDVWRPLEGVIEERWRHRFGNDEIDAVCESLQALVDRFDIDLPLYLPVLRYGDGMFARPHDGRWASAGRESDDASGLDLAALLSKVLLAFTIDFEHESKVSLAVSSNTLRVLGETGVRAHDLPRLTGVSKEAISASVGFLERRGTVPWCCTAGGTPTAVDRATPAQKLTASRTSASDSCVVTCEPHCTQSSVCNHDRIRRVPAALRKMVNVFVCGSI
jgi:hypothetical protein